MKLLIIAFSNMRKHRSSNIVTGILIAFAMLLLYSSINIIFTISGYADEVNQKQNAADIIMYTDYKDKDEIETFLKEQKKITEYEVRSLYGAGVSYQSLTKNTKKKQMEMRFLNYDEKTSISNHIIYDKQDQIKENSIILPMYLKTTEGYRSGDKIGIEYATGEVNYEVYGFIEDIMFPNPNTVGIYQCLLPQKAFDELKELGCLSGDAYLINSSDKHPSEYCKEFNKNIATKIPNLTSSVMLYINDSESMCYAASVWAYIIMSVFAVFAIFLIIIAIIVTRFTIITTIADNMPNIGILEAGGYTTKQIILANLMEYGGCAIIGVIVGLLGSVLVRSKIEEIIGSVTGLLYTSTFNSTISCVCMLLLLFLVFLTTFIVSIRLKKITPLDALRDGMNNHNFKKNHISLEKSKLPLNLAIGMKNIISNLKQNISILIIVSLLMLVTSVFFNVYYNIVVDQNGIVQLTGIEKCDIYYEMHYNEDTTIKLKTNESGEQIIDYKAMCIEISSIKGIDKVIPRGDASAYITNGDKNTQTALTAYEDFDNLRINTIIDGRYPEADNEIVLSTRTAKEIGVEIGDLVYTESTSKPLDFVVVGIEQHLYNVGTGGLVSFSGLERINSEFKVNALYIYTDKNVNIGQKIDEIRNMFHDVHSNIADYQKYFDSILVTFSSAMSAMCAFSMLITVLVVGLIIYLLIKMKILRERKMLGMYKALGFTTGQLVKQIILSYIPVILIGIILGGIVACLGGNSIVAAVFYVISGIEKCKFATMYGYIIFAGAIILVVTSILAILCSIKIRKIEPSKMISE